MLSCYFTTVGFYFSALITVFTVYVFLYGRLYLALSGLEEGLATGRRFIHNMPHQVALAYQSFDSICLSAGFDNYLPFFCGINGYGLLVLNYTGYHYGGDATVNGTDLNLPSITVAMPNGDYLGLICCNIHYVNFCFSEPSPAYCFQFLQVSNILYTRNLVIIQRSTFGMVKI